MLELVPRVMIDVVKEEQLTMFDEEGKARSTSHNSIMKDLVSTKVSTHVFVCCTVVTVKHLITDPLKSGNLSRVGRINHNFVEHTSQLWEHASEKTKFCG